MSSALPAPPTEALQHRVLTVPSPGYAPRQALRVALCAALASGLAYAAGWPHPAWAAIGAVAVQQGARLPGTIHRAWQRTLGALVGLPRLGLPVRRPLVLDGTAGRRRAADLHRNDDVA